MVCLRGEDHQVMSHNLPQAATPQPTIMSFSTFDTSRAPNQKTKATMLSGAVLRAAARPLQQGSASAGLVSSSSRGSAGASWQYYSTSIPRSSEAAAEDTAADADGASAAAEAEAPPPPFVKADAKMAARQYNDRRAAYKRAVGQMRKSFADEIAAQRKSDEEAAARKQAALTRQRLERQRAKNIQSARNAARAEEKRAARQAEFEEELRIAQLNRDARKERFAAARQLVVDELEAEAPLWMTTSEEVESALDESGSQRLWTRPGGVVGAPDPTDDASFWRYEAHTWDMSRTYSTPREELLRDLEELSYLEANVSEEYWTDGRMEEQRTLEDRAKLRAMVREEGRKELLLKQKRRMQDEYGHSRKDEQKHDGSDGEARIPRPMPAPKLDFLTNDDAMEREGIKKLKEDPTKFFRFEDEGIVKAGGGDGGEAVDRATLGRPTGLRDPVREDASGMLDGTSPYPLNVGREPRADTRTAAERKRDEREQRMLEAAQEAQAGEKKGSSSSSSSSSSNIEQAAEETLEDGSDPIDYDAIGNAGDKGDREWEAGLDPDDPGDAEILATPRQHRYTEGDVDWVIDQLTDKTERLEEVVRLEKEIQRQDMLAKMDSGDQEVADALGDATTKIEGVDERGREFVQYDLEESDVGTSSSTDTDVDALFAQVDSLRENLTAEQIEAIESIDVGDLSKMAEDEFMSSDDIAEALGKVPGLSEEQIQAMIDLEKSLEDNETIRKAVDKTEIAKDLDRLLDK